MSPSTGECAYECKHGAGRQARPVIGRMGSRTQLFGQLCAPSLLFVEGGHPLQLPLRRQRRKGDQQATDDDQCDGDGCFHAPAVSGFRRFVGFPFLPDTNLELGVNRPGFSLFLLRFRGASNFATSPVQPV